MKKFMIVALSAMLGGLAVLSSCGGGAASGKKASNDAPLGRVPAIFMEVAAKKKVLDDELRRERDMNRYQKKLKEFDEYAAKSYLKAAEEGEKLVGREIVCTGDVYPDFQVTDAKIAEYHAGKEAGSVIVRVIVAPKRDIVVRDEKRKCAEGEYSLKDTRMYFALMKADDHLIELGQLNPFNGNPYNSSLQAEYASGETVQTGVPCNRDGAPVYINCHTRDFTEFAKIVFLTEKDYMAIRQQVYGF